MDKIQSLKYSWLFTESDPLQSSFVCNCPGLRQAIRNAFSFPKLDLKNCGWGVNQPLPLDEIHSTIYLSLFYQMFNFCSCTNETWKFKHIPPVVRRVVIPWYDMQMEVIKTLWILLSAAEDNMDITALNIVCRIRKVKYVNLKNEFPQRKPWKKTKHMKHFHI